ncbi:MAG: hypothetical protein GC162_02395 [Planctomycetes bacterium]|nr:hypothetical protein [Planctomycetota bacterium]
MRLLRVFARHGVEIMIVDGQAEVLFGSPRLTYDVDLCYRRTDENLKRLAGALREIGVTLRDAPPDLPFMIDARTLAMGSNFTFNTPMDPLDLLGWIEPIGDYDALLAHSETWQLSGMNVRTIGLDDLIRVKEHIARAKDSESLHQLRAIREIRRHAEGG